MTLSEKKIELVQALLLLQDKAALFEIERLLAQAFKAQGSGSSLFLGKKPTTFEVWAAQFDAPDESEDEHGFTPLALRQRIWAAEQGAEMTLEAFFQRLSQN